MTAGTTLVTVEEFFGPPARSRARISPDGTEVAYLAPWRDRLNVVVRDLDGDWPDTDASDDPAARRVTSDDRRSIETFSWAADGRYPLFTQDTDGDENHHLHRVDLTRPEEPAVDLTPIHGARVLGTQLCADRPGTVLVQLNARRPDLADLYEIDLDTTRSTVLAENPGTSSPGCARRRGASSPSAWPTTARTCCPTGTPAHPPHQQVLRSRPPLRRPAPRARPRTGRGCGSVPPGFGPHPAGPGRPRRRDQLHRHVRPRRHEQVGTVGRAVADLWTSWRFRHSPPTAAEPAAGRATS